MGRKRKIKSAAGDLVAAPSVPLDKQIERGKIAESKARHVPDTIEGLHSNEFINEKLSAKILSLARKQREELEDENVSEPQKKRIRNVKIRKHHKSDSSSDEEDDDELEAMTKSYAVEVIHLDPAEEEAVNKFLMPKEEPNQTRRTLFDIIQDKIEQKKHDLHAVETDFHIQIRELHPDVVNMYKEVGELMTKYRSGKVPKAFKIIPSMVNWEQILELTNPDKWSAAAMLQATRLFSSNLNKAMCQRFYNLVLLPRIRDDIDEFKKLNFHLYQSLYKALYRPDAFFKGMLLPLCQSGTCTLREAIIIGSILRKCSIPMAHSAAAMLRIAEMEYTGSSSLFLRILIEKKYTLPYKVLDVLVEHFYRMKSETRMLPVLWHQSLLAFAQHYKSDLNVEQRKKLLDLIKVQNHYQMTPEIRRELEHADAKQNEESEKHTYVRNDGMEF